MVVRFEQALDEPADAGVDDGETRETRTIEGVAITYGVEAVAADGMTYRFRPGSLSQARDVTPVLLGHDRQRPVGVLAGLVQDDEAARAVLRLDQTPDGDLALAQAASGSRAGLSVGAEPIIFSIDEATGVVDVETAELAELSLVTIGAYPGANVTRVNAEEGKPIMPESQPPAEPPNPAPELVDPPEIRPRLVIAAERPSLDLTADQYVGALIAASKGDREAAKLVEFAATFVPVHVADVPGVIPPTITNEILGELPSTRPLASICASRPLPGSGMLIRKPIWGVKPNGGWMADDTADPATNAPTITLKDVPILQWAYAFRTSVAVAERSSPDYIESVYRNSIIDYYNDVEAKIATTLNAIAAVPGATVGTAVATVYSVTRHAADLLICSPGAFGKLVDAGGLNQFTTGSVSASPMRGNVYGLDVVVSGALATNTAYVGVRGAFELRESAPIRLSANVVGAMNVELGITSFASLDQEIASAFSPVDAATITVLSAQGASKAKGA